MTKPLSSDQAKAASAHSRINVPLNLKNWQEVDSSFHPDLLWFHQHILDQGMGFNEVEQAVDYNWNTVYKFLTGTSSGSYDNFVERIRSYRKIAEKRQSIQQQEFVHNSIAKIVFSTLDYTLANNCMTLIVGESGMGKSTIVKAWRDENNHGTSLYTDCPPGGSVKHFLRAIGHGVGVGDGTIPGLMEAICRSLNPNRILLLDNMHRALPADPRTAARIFDTIQYIQEDSGCAVAMSATARLDSYMRSSTHMFEQITGRVGIPIYIDSKVRWSDIDGIVRQYIPEPTSATKDHAIRIANGDGHIRQLVERLKVGSRIAHKAGAVMDDSHFLTAIRIRTELAKHNPNQKVA